MNEFDNLQVNRQILGRNIIPAWVVFREAVSDNVNSYNRIKEGIEHPARILQSESDTKMLVQCDFGMTRDTGEVMVIVVNALCHEKQYAIEANIERWLRGLDLPRKDSFSSTRFQLKAEPSKQLGFAGSEEKYWLECNEKPGEKLSPNQAAEMVMVKALRHRGNGPSTI